MFQPCCQLIQFPLESVLHHLTKLTGITLEEGSTKPVGDITFKSIATKPLVTFSM